MLNFPLSPKRKLYFTPEFVKAYKQFEPANVLEIDIATALPSLQMFDEVKQRSYSRAQLLIKCAGQPLGIKEVRLPLSAAVLAELIWEQFEGQIQTALQKLGQGPINELTSEGLSIAAEHIEKNSPFISVVLATRNKNEAIEPCLHSLLAQSYRRFEIIVVDNAPSSPVLYEFIQKNYGHEKRIRYIREDRPGLAVAHNRGLLEAKGEFIAITDDDVEVDERWLCKIRDAFALSDKVACVTGLILPLELETPAQAWLEQYGGFNRGFDKKLYDLHENHPGDPLFPFTAGRFGSGANMSFRKEVLLELGGFDPSLGAGSPGVGGDDLASFFEVVSAGHTLVYEPAAIIYHQHRRDYEALRKQVYNYGIGLTAYLTKTILDKPSRALFLARQFFRGLYHMFGASSPKNQNKKANYPLELARLEFRGMFLGPLAYWRGRKRAKKPTSLDLPESSSKTVVKDFS